MTTMIRGSIAMAALALLASCGSSTEGPNASIDLNAALSQTSLGDVAFTPEAWALFGFPDPGVFPSFDSRQCPYSGGSQSFVCPTQAVDGITFTSSFMLLDASGHSQSALDPATTSAVRVVFDAIGHPTFGLATPPTMAINHHSDLTLSGLTSSPRTLNGSSRDRDTVTSGFGSSATRTTIDATSTTTNLVFPSNGSRYPASGTITTDFTTGFTPNSLPTITSTTHAVITFNGTSVINIVITSSGTTSTCQIDLSNGNLHCN